MANNLTPEQRAKAVAEAKQRAKDLRTKGKREKAEARERRRTTDDPSQMGTLRQLRTVVRMTSEHDPALKWWLLGALLVPLVVAVVIGLLLGHTWLLLLDAVLGLLIGLLLALVVLRVRAQRATYSRYAGEAGSAEVALQMLPKRTWTSTPAVAFTKQRDVVHRAVGPAGVVLIGEGSSGRARQLLASEVKKHERVLVDVPVTPVTMGDGEGQVPLADLTKHLKKLPKAVERHQIDEVTSRLQALDAVRPRMDVPKGPMPTSPRGMRGMQRGLRGR